ncbi:YigZ family protein [Hydrogenophaga sp. 5NK40-0174]|uniref:IMPACT family protein n=1 Tax=Hydrogenophaga sp. 5NK40-0174 TaxID=3127649 RepID=UPI0031062B71
MSTSSIAQPVQSELVIKKSRFLGRVEPVSDRATAVARVAQLRAEHPGANHVCWALMAGGHSAANDDGEPSGTAGRPMLEVLRHQSLEGVLATVVRYFGGVQLGAGGLVRAYTDAIAQALLTAEKVPIVAMQTLSCRIPYTLEGWVRRELEAHDAQLLDVAHQSDVHVTLVVPVDHAQTLRQRIDDASQGAAQWTRAEEASGFN